MFVDLQLKSTTKLAVLLLLLGVTLYSSIATAQIKGGIDLEAVMKQMRFEYTQAMKTGSAEKFNQHILEFKKQLKIAAGFPYNKERKVKALEGLDKVTVALNAVKLPIDAENLAQSKQALYVIDDLRNDYHDKKPSLWQRFIALIFAGDESQLLPF
ncbi:MAG: hypothetical protein OFPI_20460 [Osedax symbiont Rs2]|nr:MAG: hypothetical protein OFPI_20460 [Osedax symbiont Rs2]